MVLLNAQEVARIAQAVARDYRSVHFDTLTAGGGQPEIQIAKTAFSDSTADTVANNEHRRIALALASRKLEGALADLRSAHGLVTGALEANRSDSKGSAWTSEDLEATESQARDRNPRGMGKRVAVRSIRSTA